MQAMRTSFRLGVQAAKIISGEWMQYQMGAPLLVPSTVAVTVPADHMCEVKDEE